MDNTQPTVRILGALVEVTMTENLFGEFEATVKAHGKIVSAKGKTDWLALNALQHRCDLASVFGSKYQEQRKKELYKLSVWNGTDNTKEQTNGKQ